jgi:hypothetical protein
MFDSLFARFTPRRKPPDPMRLWELANAATIYSVGFIAIFLLFALMYYCALSRREQLGLSALDARTNIGHHLLGVSVGVLSATMASCGPLELAPIAPTTYCLMGPAHFAFGTMSGRKRRLLEDELAQGAPEAAAQGS